VLEALKSVVPAVWTSNAFAVAGGHQVPLNHRHVINNSQPGQHFTKVDMDQQKDEDENDVEDSIDDPDDSENEEDI